MLRFCNHSPSIAAMTTTRLLNAMANGSPWTALTATNLRLFSKSPSAWMCCETELQGCFQAGERILRQAARTDDAVRHGTIGDSLLRCLMHTTKASSYGMHALMYVVRHLTVLPVATGTIAKAEGISGLSGQGVSAPGQRGARCCHRETSGGLCFRTPSRADHRTRDS